MDLDDLFGEKKKAPLIQREKEVYKVGDYVTCDTWIIMRIVTILNEDTSNPTYGLWNHKKSHMTWETAYTFDKQNMHKVTPDFEGWAKVKTGDMIHTGVTGDRTYLSVIARVGDAVLFSLQPASRKQRQKFNEIASQIEEMTDGAVDLKEQMQLPPSTQGAYKTASDDWMTVEQLALMNWELVTEEV